MTGLGSEDLQHEDRGFEAELALNDDDSLPWLESDEYEEAAGDLDTARILGFAFVILLLIGAGVGGAWWFTQRNNQTEYVADGSTVEAPPGPYKERPEDPGGKEFAGTGSIAPAVGEGEVREGVLREDPPAPSIATLPSGEQPSTSVAGPSAAPIETLTDSGGISVQVGAYRSRQQAEAGWVTLQGQTSALNGVRRRVVRAEADIGTVYRLQALPGDLAAARALCSELKADGVACQVKR